MIELLRLPPATPQETETTSDTAKVCVVDDCQADPTPEQVMRLIEKSGTLDLWLHPDKDIYGDLR